MYLIVPEINIRAAFGIGEKAKPFLKSTKSEKERIVPLNPAAVEALKSVKVRQAKERLKEGPDYVDNGFVFGNKRGEVDANELMAVSRQFSSLARTAGVEDCGLHGLRHTFASWALAAGVDIRTLAGILGHSDAVTTLRVYSHLLPGTKAKAIAAIGALLEAAQAKITNEENGSTREAVDG